VGDGVVYPSSKGIRCGTQGFLRIAVSADLHLDDEHKSIDTSSAVVFAAMIRSCCTMALAPRRLAARVLVLILLIMRPIPPPARRFATLLVG